MLSRSRQHGVTLIELAVGLAIVGVLLALALPAFGTFLRNTRVKNAAENILAGLQLARTEAVRRNVSVTFQMVSDMTAACTVSSGIITSPSWIVSLDDATGLCDIAPSDTVAPRAIQKWNAAEGASGSGIVWNIVASGGPSSVIQFNSLGRLTGSPLLNRQFDIEVYPSVAMSCVPSGDVRCLRIKVSTGGQVRMCDPQMSVTTDPRYCG